MKITKQIIFKSVLLAVMCGMTQAFAAGQKLQAMAVQAGPGGKSDLVLNFSGPTSIPKGFVMENPPRLVFDFPGVEVTPNARRSNQAHGVIRSVQAAGGNGRARVVVKMSDFVGYTVEPQGNRMVMRFEQSKAGHGHAGQTGRAQVPANQTYNYYRAPQNAAAMPTVPAPRTSQNVPVARPIPAARPVPAARPIPAARPVPAARAVPEAQPIPQYNHQQARRQQLALQQKRANVNHGHGLSAKAIRSVDFRRKENGGGRMIIVLPNSNTKINDVKRGNNLSLTLHDVDVPRKWQKTLDVTDFGTPVNNIKIQPVGLNASIRVISRGEYKYEMERDRNILTVHFNKIAPKKRAALPGEAKKKTFKGEKLSLNFQDIEVRAVLQLLADFTDKNIVVSDSVEGSITVRLKDVPWDQALDIVLESKNLGMRENGNVIWVAPDAELKAKEAEELAAMQQKIQLEPLITEYIPINYAKAEELMKLIDTANDVDGADHSNSLLSSRGSASFDTRTNTLLIQDTQDRVDEIKTLVTALDVPVEQVLVESRIVIASSQFGKELGTKFGLTPKMAGNNTIGIGGGSLGAAQGQYQVDVNNLQAEGSGTVTTPGLPDRLNVNMPVTGAAGVLGFSVLSTDFILDLELSALQAEDKGEIVATPRVITSNQKTAFIEQGVEIPYQEASSSGATSVSFKKAVLSLHVTPQITPDEHISMDLKVHQDTVGQLFQDVPSIDTRKIETKVLVKNGQTIVLGGVHEENKIDGVEKVPVLGDLPVVGQIFRKTTKNEKKRELLIFITPKIVDSKTAAASR